MKKINKNLPWILRLNVEIRKDWFSYWWSTRGANFKEFQIWIFKISIGMPWKEIAVKSKLRDYGNLSSIKQTNDGMINNLTWAFQIGSYEKYNKTHDISYFKRI